MATFSIRARAKRSLSRNFWSMIAPVRTLRSFVRKKVSPRAFWPCWNSSTTQSPPSHSIVMPLRKSLGLTIPACDCTPLGVRRTPLPASRLDLAEDRVAQLLRTGHRAEQLGTLPAGGFELDVPEAPGPAPEALECRQVLDPIDGDRPGKLGDDALVEDDALVGQHVLVGPPAPVIEVDDSQADEEGAEHQQEAELAGDRNQRQDYHRDCDGQDGCGNRAKQDDPVTAGAGQDPFAGKQVAGVHGAWLYRTNSDPRTRKGPYGTAYLNVLIRVVGRNITNMSLLMSAQ